MVFAVPSEYKATIERFEQFISENMLPHLTAWTRAGEIPLEFFNKMGAGGWYGFEETNGNIVKRPAQTEALVAETLAAVSPGVAIAVLAHMDLGFIGLFLFGSEALKKRYGQDALRGNRLMCLGNTENIAGSDVAGIGMPAQKVSGGWLLNGTKAYVTNGYLADLAVITAVTEPEAPRNRRLSMFLVDLNSPGIRRKKLNKQVWIPSDLTRLSFEDTFVPDDHLLGVPDRGLQQVLEIFTRSRIPISALTLGTAMGALEKAIRHGVNRKIFGRPIVEFQAKAFEIADLYAEIEAARLMCWKACEAADQGIKFRAEASMAKYLAVEIARKTTLWAADLFGAASVIFEHPIHKYPMDAWAASLGEGTQDVQKLVIFRELMEKLESG